MENYICVGLYEVYEGVTYELDGDIYKDVHHVRPMTNAEKAEKQNAVKTQWAQDGFASWVFDEETCGFNPPTPKPLDGKQYSWDEATTSWIEITT